MSIIIIALTVVVIAQVIERHLYAHEMNKQIADNVRAIIAKNTNEYMSMKSSDEDKKVEIKEPEDTYLDQADDETFNKFIKSQT